MMRNVCRQVNIWREANEDTNGVALHDGRVMKKTSRKMTKADLKCTDSIGPKRSLNAWMGFRCEYTHQ